MRAGAVEYLNCLKRFVMEPSSRLRNTVQLFERALSSELARFDIA
jgi:hypothetical protein